MIGVATPFTPFKLVSAKHTTHAVDCNPWTNDRSDDSSTHDRVGDKVVQSVLIIRK